MRKVFLFMMVSLDGCFEGGDHDLSWHNVDEEFNKFAVEQMKEVDTLIFGRRTYDLMSSYWPTAEAEDPYDQQVFEMMNSYKKVVFSHQNIKIDWKNTELMQNISELAKLKELPGKDMAIFGSNNLCISLLKTGLLDEIRIMVAPVVIGEENKLFTGLDQKLTLKLLKSKEFKNGNVLLNYQPVT
jgi:dihydrofolate reductase